MRYLPCVGLEMVALPETLAVFPGLILPSLSVSFSVFVKTSVSPLPRVASLDR